MAAEPLEQVVRNIDVRLAKVEQILPTLATKDELREEGERTRRHFDVVAERFETRVRLIAEGHVALTDRVDGVARELREKTDALDVRVTRLETRRRQ